MRSRRLAPTAAAVTFVALTALPAIGAGRTAGPTIRGHLAAASPQEARGAVVELFPLLDPHAQALVELGREAAPTATASVRVGADGAFTLRAPGPGPWRLRVTVPGHLPQERVLDPGFDPVELEPVPRMPAQRVAVTVRGSGGEPIPGARLRTVGVGELGWWGVTAGVDATGEDGRAVFFRPLERMVGVAAWAPGFAESEPVGPRDSTPFSLTPSTAEPRWLALRDAAGRPLAGAVVHFAPATGDRRAASWTATAAWPAGVCDEQGRVRAALPAGAEEVKIETGRGWSVTLALPAGCGAAGSPCTLDLPAPLELTGEVFDARSSDPLGGALVWPVDEPDRAVVTNGRGRFTLRFAPGAAPWRLSVAADQYFGQAALEPPAEAGPLLVALEPALRVAGRVVDPDGAPLEGVRIRLRAWGNPRWSEPPEGYEVETTSGADGRFQLWPVPARPDSRLRAELPGFAPAEARPVQGAADDLEIVLTPGGALVGRLIDRAGEPVPRGRVRLLEASAAGGLGPVLDGSEIGADVESAAAEDGRFAIHHLAAGRYLLLVLHPDHARLRLPPVEVAEGETVDLGAIELGPGGALAGRVVDPGGEPVEGAVLQAGSMRDRTYPDFYLTAHGRTGSDGRFELTGLPEGEPLQLTANRSGYPAAELTGIELPLAEPLVVELRRGSRVLGRVLGPRDEPIEGANVMAAVTLQTRDDSPGGASGHARTAADGSFEIAGLVAGALDLRVRKAGYPPGELLGLEIGDEGDLGPVEIRLEAGAEVTGRVLAPDGSPAPGASVAVHTGMTPAELGIDRPSVLARPTERVRTSTAFGRSDARGEFVIGGVLAGPATVRADHDRLGEAVAELQVHPGTNSIQLVLDAGGRIEGRAIDRDGAPVARALVLATALEPAAKGNAARSDETGRFLLHRLSPGDYQLDASSHELVLDGPPVTVAVGDGPTPFVELVLGPGEEITGRILGIPDTELPGIQMFVHRKDLGPLRPASLSVGGRYRVRGLLPGTWIVSARSKTGRFDSGEVEVVAGGGPYLLDLDLGGGLTVTGSVRVDGEPLAGTVVGIAAAGGEPRITDGQTAFDGTFRIEGLEPGSYEISVGLGAPQLGQRELTLTADQEVHFDLVTSRLAGRLLDAEGRPIAGASVVATTSLRSGFGGSAGTGFTDTAGRFELPPLPPGRYQVTAMVQGEPRARAEVTLEPGDRREIELRVEPDPGPAP